MISKAGHPGPNTKPSEPSVLLIDDNSAGLQTMRMLFELQGYRVLTAQNGTRGIEIFRIEVPDVVILDLGLPDMHGFEVAKKLRSLAHGQDALIIGVSGWGDADTIALSHQSGINHHLAKPINFEELERLLPSDATTTSAQEEQRQRL